MSGPIVIQSATPPCPIHSSQVQNCFLPTPVVSGSLPAACLPHGIGLPPPISSPIPPSMLIPVGSGEIVPFPERPDVLGRFISSKDLGDGMVLHHYQSKREDQIKVITFSLTPGQTFALKNFHSPLASSAGEPEVDGTFLHARVPGMYDLHRTRGKETGQSVDVITLALEKNMQGGSFELIIGDKTFVIEDSETISPHIATPKVEFSTPKIEGGYGDTENLKAPNVLKMKPAPLPEPPDRIIAVKGQEGNPPQTGQAQERDTQHLLDELTKLKQEKQDLLRQMQLDRARMDKKSREQILGVANAAHYTCVDPNEQNLRLWLCAAKTEKSEWNRLYLRTSPSGIELAYVSDVAYKSGGTVNPDNLKFVLCSLDKNSQNYWAKQNLGKDQQGKDVTGQDLYNCDRTLGVSLAVMEQLLFPQSR